MRMVAPHDGDVWGAVRADSAAGFVARGDIPFGLGDPPDIVGPNLTVVSEALLRADEPEG